MRKWHRWLVVVTGVFMIWIAATGLIGQAMTLAGGEDHDGPPPVMAKEAPAAPLQPNPTVAPHTAARGDDHDGPPAKRGGPPHDLYHLLIDLHSDNFFGPLGKIISVLMGASLLFFAVSGMWMYVDMFRKRKNIGRSGIFWD